MKFFLFILLSFLFVPVFSQQSPERILLKLKLAIKQHQVKVEDSTNSQIYLNKNLKILDFDGREIELLHCTFVYSEYFHEKLNKKLSVVNFKCDDEYDCILRSSTTNGFKSTRVTATGFFVKTKESAYDIINLLSDLKTSLGL